MKEPIKRIGKQIINCLKCHVYQIFYAIMSVALWIYVISNWDKCIHMQFFSQFDGNNILFLVGILLPILPFYEVEGKGFKIRRMGVKALEHDLQKKESEFQKTTIENTIVMMQDQNMQSRTEVTENNELSVSK